MVELIDETKRCPHPDLLEVSLNRYLQDIGSEQIVTLIICDDATIHRMNLADRSVDAPTDVLSYALEEPGESGLELQVPIVEQLGDIFISLDTAERQAPEFGRDTLEELIVLAAHGVTHLRGFDHETEAAWQTFHAAQKRALDLYHARR